MRVLLNERIQATHPKLPEKQRRSFCSLARPCRRSHQSRCSASSGGNGDAQRPLVVVGSINADLVLQVSRMPDAGETLEAATLDTFPGGKVLRLPQLGASPTSNRIVMPCLNLAITETDGLILKIATDPFFYFQGANQAAAAARLGWPTQFVGQVSMHERPTITLMTRRNC